MEETLEGGRGPPRAVEPLERARERHVQLLACHKLNFQVPTFLALLLCNNTALHHINTDTMGKIVINNYTNASTAVVVLIVTIILNIIQHTQKENI